MTEEVNPDKDYEYAWQIYSAADDILHSRLQTNMIAQSFLVGATAILLTNSAAENYVSFFGLLTAGIACFTTLFMHMKISSIHKKMVVLRRRWFRGRGGDIFEDYMSEGKTKTSARDLVYGQNVQTFWVLWLLYLFWIAVFIMWVIIYNNPQIIPSILTQ